MMRIAVILLFLASLLTAGGCRQAAANGGQAPAKPRVAAKTRLVQSLQDALKGMRVLPGRHRAELNRSLEGADQQLSSVLGGNSKRLILQANKKPAIVTAGRTPLSQPAGPAPLPPSESVTPPSP